MTAAIHGLCSYSLLMKITDFLHSEDIIPSLAATSKAEVLAELAAMAVERQGGLDVGTVLHVLQERERLGSTGIGDGIAIPHGKLKDVGKLVMVFGRSRKGIDFDSLDGKPAHLFFLLVAPEDAASAHLKILARMSRLLKEDRVRKCLMSAPDGNAIFEIISEQDSRH